MKSSIALLRVFRRTLWIGLFVEVVVVLVTALHGLKPTQPDSLRNSFIVSYFLAAVLSLCLSFQSGCNRVPFPVSVRQRAWLPILVFVGFWMAGMLTLGFAVLVRAIWPPVLVFSLLSLVAQMPLYLLLWLMAYRLWCSLPHLIVYPFFILLLITQYDNEWFQTCISTYHLWWPIPLIFIVYYVYELPHHFARLDRYLVGSRSKNTFAVRDQNISLQSHPVNWPGDYIESLWLAALTIILALFIIQGFKPLYLQNSTITVVLSVILPLFVIVFNFVSIMQTARCSGFGPLSAIGVTCLNMTIVLAPLARTLGLRKGIAARCTHCRGLKFVWAPECPHCDTESAGTIQNKRLASVAPRHIRTMPNPRRVIARVMIPLQFFLIFGLMTSISNRPFITHQVSLLFDQDLDEHLRQQAIQKIQGLVETRPLLDDWMDLPPVSHASPVTPERYRINVKLFNNKSLWVRSFGLRWDPAGSLPHPIAQRLADEIRDICEVMLVPSKKASYSNGSPLQTRWYLDKRIHWNVLETTRNE